MVEYIDDEEKELIESLHELDWQPNPDKELNKVYEGYARNYFEFKNKVEVNLTDWDFNKIQIKAIENGMPYQTIISLLVHNYNKGKIGLTL